MKYIRNTFTCNGLERAIVEGNRELIWFALREEKVNALRELQSTSGEELRPLFGRTLMPSVLDRAFKGEL